MGAQPDREIGDDDAVMRDLSRHAHATPSLSDREQRQLLARASGGDRTSLDRLVAANLGMVIKLARSRGDRGLSLSDLVQEGSLGLVEAVRSFEPHGDLDFTGFAERKVVDAIDTAIAAEAAAVRDAELLVAAANDYERVELLLRRELQRDPTAVEIAQKLEWSAERTRYVAQVVADARRAYDEEMLAFVDPEVVDLDDVIEG